MYFSIYRCLLIFLDVQVTAGQAAENFGWHTESTTADPANFLSAVQGTCAAVHNCTGGSGGSEELDCSNMPSYECESYSDASIDTAADGTKTLFFEASLDSGSACGEASCRECTHYRSCAGPFLQTTPITMPAGSFVQWEWLATGRVDWYEVVVAVYSIDQTVVEVVDTDLNLIPSNMIKLESVAFQRGATTDWVTQQLIVNDEGTFFVRFHLGSYDETGGGLVGAEMKVRNFQFLYPTTFTSLTTFTHTMTTTATETNTITTTGTNTITSTRTDTASTSITTKTTSITATTVTKTSTATNTRTNTASTMTTTSTTTTSTTVFECPTVVCAECSYWPWLLAGFLAGLVLGFFLAWLCFRRRPVPKVVPEVIVEVVPDPPEPTPCEPEPVVEEEPPEPPEEPMEPEEEEIPAIEEEEEEEEIPEPDPDPGLDIERVLILLYPTLKAIFQFYSSAGTVGDGDLFRMNLKQWLQMLSDSKLDVTKTRAEIIFKESVRDGRAARRPGARPNFLRVHRSDLAELDGMAMQSKRGGGVRHHGVEEEKDLGYAEFVNALLRVAWDGIEQPVRTKARDGGPLQVRIAVGTALWTLVEDKVRPHAGRFDGCISLRDAAEEPPAKGVLAKASSDAGLFGKVFKAYHDNKTGHMLLNGFDLWARHSGLHKQLSMPRLRECFVWAGDKDRGRAPEGWYPSQSLNEEAKVFIGPDYSRDETLTRQEFALACARIAYILKGPNESELTPESLAAAIASFSHSIPKV
eukprot:TRINITY_DN14347_c0_g1_i2.p1 TRINITY_DN14347_c0_g1~~TRINITY_DN14347_c0_g1_i2.p1  ORF type:complete len:752 (+),score=118.37 TRINITY_DN14347_c0_g1_i2:37-2292(+)